MVQSARINGKPRIVSQKYLGTIENIANAVDSLHQGGVPEPEFSKIYDYGGVTALFDLAERLGVREIVESHTNKRDQGLPVSDTVLLATINRAVEPVSKNGFFKWFDNTVLYNLINKATKKNLSSQGFWNNMNELNEDQIRNIEDDITKKIVSTYNIDTDCLLFDNTNFFTYIDTKTTSALAKRGKSKEHRADLRIIGMSLMVSPDHNLPLFHEAYPGNMNDAKRFSEVVERLKARYQKLGNGECIPTFVFDRGNNSDDNIKNLLTQSPKQFHIVGGLRFNQCPEITSIPKTEYSNLEGDRYNGYKALRSKKTVYDTEFTVIITYNPELYQAQLDGVEENISKCKSKIEELQTSLTARALGIVKKGKKPTFESVSKRVNDILSADHMKSIFDKKIEENGNSINVECSLNLNKFENLKENVLGKSIIFTDNDNWATERIVSAYHSQYHVEECFRQMKDTKYLSFRPQYHYTDSHIKVHTFYCVLSLMLCSLLQIEMEQLGYNMSIHKLLDTLCEIKQVITVFPKVKNTQINKSSFAGLDGVAKEYFDHYGLIKYSIKV
jgi:transposase